MADNELTQAITELMGEIKASNKDNSALRKKIEALNEDMGTLKDIINELLSELQKRK
jgi:uncharacterized coiled-coil DUF342 family protein